MSSYDEYDLAPDPNERPSRPAPSPARPSTNPSRAGSGASRPASSSSRPASNPARPAPAAPAMKSPAPAAPTARASGTAAPAALREQVNAVVTGCYATGDLLVVKDGAVLPERCIKCNTPTTQRITKRLGY